VAVEAALTLMVFQELEQQVVLVVAVEKMVDPVEQVILLQLVQLKVLLVELLTAVKLLLVVEAVVLMLLVALV